jgi:hypothetical protein
MYKYCTFALVHFFVLHICNAILRQQLPMAHPLPNISF